MNSKSRRRRRRVLTAALVLLVAAGAAAYVLVLGKSGKSTPPAPPTEVVKSGDVRSVAVKRLAESRAKLQTKSERTAAEKTIRDSARAEVEGARAQIVALAGTREANRKKAEEEEAKERKKIEEDERREREKASEEEREFKGGGTVITRNPETGTIAAEAQVQ
jgi:hypothetical protein